MPPKVERRTFVGASGVPLVAAVSGRTGGLPIVLLHGGGQTHAAWGKFSDALVATGYRVIAPDLRGHGESGWPGDSDYRFDAFVGDLREMLRAESQLPVLVGASLGGITSLLAVGESVQPIARALVLVDITPVVEPEGVMRIKSFMMANGAGFPSIEAAASAVSEYLPHRTGARNLAGLRKNLRQRSDKRWYWHWDPKLLTGPLVGDVLLEQDRLIRSAMNIHIPTLLVRGLLSDLVSAGAVAEFKRLIPHAECIELEGAAHMVAGDSNEAFGFALQDFVERVAPLPPGSNDVNRDVLPGATK